MFLTSKGGGGGGGGFYLPLCWYGGTINNNCNIFVLPTFDSGLDIRARPLTQVSVKNVGQVQITDHLPGWASRIFISRIYYSK